MNEYPQIPAQHDIDRRATALVEGWLAKDWLVRRQSHDYGFDYLIERVEGGVPSGLIFHAQQKGTRKVQFDTEGRSACPIETRHLRYYQRKVQAPVFLFYVDVDSGGGWFCHVQAELIPYAEKLDKQQTVSLPLRLDQSLHDSARLLRAVTDAVAFMREANPGSLQASFRQAVAAHKQIDPDFTILKAEVTGAGTRYIMEARRDLAFSLKVPENKGREVNPKLDELFKYGRSLKLTSSEVEFVGLSIFDKAKADGLVSSIVFKSAQTIPCEITLVSTGQFPFHLSFPASLSRGNAGGLLTAKADDCPLGLELKVNKEEMLRAGVGSIQFTWDMTAWFGKKLRSLPWIEPIAQCWLALFSSAEVSVTITSKGNRIVRGNFGRQAPPEVFRPQMELCNMLFHAHELAIARGFDITLIDKPEFWNFDWDEIIAASELEAKGRHERPAPDYRISFRVPAEGDDLLRIVDSESSAGGSASLTHHYIIDAFSQELDLGIVETNVSPVSLHRIPLSSTDRNLVQIRGGPTTRVEMTRRTDLTSLEAKTG